MKIIARIGVALLILINSIVCKKTSNDVIPEAATCFCTILRKVLM